MVLKFFSLYHKIIRKDYVNNGDTDTCKKLIACANSINPLGNYGYEDTGIVNVAALKALYRELHFKRYKLSTE